MKIHAALLSLLLVTGCSSQNQNTSLANLSVCTELGELSGSVMSARQSGIELSKLLEVTVNINNTDENTKQLVYSMIMLAYDSPLYSTEEYKKRAIINFKNTTVSTCLQGLK